MEIYLIRHTRPDIPKNTCYGQSDIDVLPSFPQELASIQQQLCIDETFAVYSSPLKRCLILAQALSCNFQFPTSSGSPSGIQHPASSIQIDNRLKELDFGNWELKLWDKLNRTELDEWTKDFVNIRVPGGESCREMYDRSVAFLDELFTKNYEKAAIVTHGGVIRSMLAHILGMPLENMFRLRIDYSSISRIDYSIEKQIPAVWKTGNKRMYRNLI